MGLSVTPSSFIPPQPPLLTKLRGKGHSGLIILGGLTGIYKYESWVKKEEGGVRITTTAATTLGEEPSGTLVIGVT